jgi:hypothetical protein
MNLFLAFGYPGFWRIRTTLMEWTREKRRRTCLSAVGLGLNWIRHWTVDISRHVSQLGTLEQLFTFLWTQLWERA